MNPNADYLGIVTMLRRLREQGLVSGSEAKKDCRASNGTAWRGHHYFSLISSLLGIAIADGLWYCVLLTKEVAANEWQGENQRFSGYGSAGHYDPGSESGNRAETPRGSICPCQFQLQGSRTLLCRTECLLLQTHHGHP